MVSSGALLGLEEAVEEGREMVSALSSTDRLLLRSSDLEPEPYKWFAIHRQTVSLPLELVSASHGGDGHVKHTPWPFVPTSHGIYPLLGPTGSASPGSAHLPPGPTSVAGVQIEMNIAGRYERSHRIDGHTLTSNIQMDGNANRPRPFSSTIR